MYKKFNAGFIELIVGPMFAGKTEELIRRVTVLSYGKDVIKVFKPKKDDRYDADKISSHNGRRLDSILVKNPQEIYDHITEDTTVVAIDEIQFFDESIVDLCDHLADRGIRVMAAGLDNDFKGNPFSIVPDLMTISELVTKLTAVCTKCGNTATRSQREINGKPAHYDDEIVVVGASESYTAVCRSCHQVPGKFNEFDKGDD